MLYTSDIAFTPAVKAAQRRKGTRAAYERMEISRAWSTEITPELKSFIEAQTSVFLASASAQGRPYIQHRGGAKGFLNVQDSCTIAFADFEGNRQYITQGNLSENPTVQLLLMDYVSRRRIKIWGEARVVEDDPTLVEKLIVTDCNARATRAIVLTVRAWDANCPKHISQRLAAEDVAVALAERDRKITQLEAELRAALDAPQGAITRLK